jgi:aquaporin Z
MTLTETNLAAAPAEALNVEPAQPRLAPSRTPSPRLHWQEYAMEGALLGAFMVSACLFGILYELPSSPVRQAISSDFLRRVLMGLSMGSTAVALIYSPWGKQSGAHINPSVTLAFLRLGKINGPDALFYLSAQFVGAALAVALLAAFLRAPLSHPRVAFVATVPGRCGVLVATVAEIVISFAMMTMVLNTTSRQNIARFTGLFAGALVATYISLVAPLSGMSMNPARSFGSAFPSGIWTNFWIYLVAPPIGMLAAAELYLFQRGRHAVGCAKLHHDNDKRCIFCGANGGFSQ